jgi:hypothetical protein
MSARDAELAELITVRKADIAMYQRKLSTQADESRESETLIDARTVQRDEAQANSAKIASSAPHDLLRFQIGKANFGVCETR